MNHKISVSAPQLKQFMGTAFNYEMYSRGRSDVRTKVTGHNIEALRAEAIEALTETDQINLDITSYWIGWFRELDFFDDDCLP